MKKYYIAAFVPEEDGSGYSVYFPDVPRCFTGGETLEEAMFMAEDVLRLVLQDMAAERKEIPAPSGLEAVRKKVEEERALDGLSTPADTVYQLVAAPELDMVPVKVTIDHAGAAFGGAVHGGGAQNAGSMLRAVRGRHGGGRGRTGHHDRPRRRALP